MIPTFRSHSSGSGRQTVSLGFRTAVRCPQCSMVRSRSGRSTNVEDHTMGSRASWPRTMVMSLGCAAALVIVQSFSVSQADAVLTSVRYFLQITDPAILGESTVVGHLGEIDLLSFTMSF